MESNNSGQLIDFEKINLSRKAAEITLARVNNFDELWAKTKEEGDQKFIQKTKEIWKEFAVHGILGFNKEGKKTILNFTDLDGKCSLALLKLAKINTENVKYVAPGEFIEGGINIDTGYQNGLVLKDNGKTVFMDHHGDESGNDTSATKVVYEVLTSLGLLKKEKYLDNLVEFVTQVDNKTFPYQKDYFTNSFKTVIGLQRFIETKHLFDFFRAGKNPAASLNPDELSQMGLLQRSKEQESLIKLSEKRFKEMKLEGLVIPSKKYGTIAIDIGNTLKNGFDAARSFGCDTYIIWNPKEESFFINTVNKLPNDFSLSQGKRIRENMWIKSRKSELDQNNEPLKIELKEIIEKLTESEYSVLNVNGKLNIRHL